MRYQGIQEAMPHQFINHVDPISLLPHFFLRFLVRYEVRTTSPNQQPSNHVTPWHHPLSDAGHVARLTPPRFASSQPTTGPTGPRELCWALGSWAFPEPRPATSTAPSSGCHGRRVRRGGFGRGGTWEKSGGSKHGRLRRWSD